MTRSKVPQEFPCLSRGMFGIEASGDGSFLIRMPACRNERCPFRLYAADLFLQADDRGLVLNIEDGVSSEAEVRAYLAGWRFFARDLLAERRMWAQALSL